MKFNFNMLKDDKKSSVDYWKLALIFFVIAVFGLLAYEFSPFFDHRVALAKVQASHEYMALYNSLTESIGETQSMHVRKLFIYPLSDLVQISIDVDVFYDGRMHVDNLDKYSISPRYDRLVIVVGTAIAIFVVLVNRVDVKSLLSVEINLPVRSLDSKVERDAPLSAMTIFEKEVEEVSLRAKLIFDRSTVLLAVGIIMAFIGVLVFYLTLPEGVKDELIGAYLVRSVRSTGVLIFIEAIAWFLLRQYRVLIDDYKGFHYLLMRRVNFLAAINIAGKNEVRDVDVFLMVALLQDDVSDRLKSGETTEGLERARLADGNFVQVVLSQLIDRLPGSRVMSPKD